MTDVVFASTKTMRTLADGGMTVTLDIAPEHFEAAFRLFGKAGSTVGVAAITGDAARTATQRAAAEAPKDRPSFLQMRRAQQAGIRCNEPAFMAYLSERFHDHLGGQPVVDTDGAANVVRWHCMVISRRELDGPNGAKGTLWDNLEADYWAKQHGMKP